jgi:hypothetical protein
MVEATKFYIFYINLSFAFRIYFQVLTQDICLCVNSQNRLPPLKTSVHESLLPVTMSLYLAKGLCSLIKVII